MESVQAGFGRRFEPSGRRAMGWEDRDAMAMLRSSEPVRPLSGSVAAGTPQKKAAPGCSPDAASLDLSIDL